MKLPMKPPDEAEVIRRFADNPDLLRKVLTETTNPAPGGKYRHWHTLRFVDPPSGLSHDEWWFAIKIARRAISKKLPFTDTNGRPFTFGMPDPVLEKLQSIDRDVSGRIEISEQVTNPATRDRYLVSSLIDEAITSSQLEGAATTHVVAEEMIRAGRHPTDRNEQMIFNNYKAMRHVRRLKDSPLTPDSLLELHRMLTLETLDDPSAAGRYRKPQEAIRVWDTRDNTLLHTPPAADEIPKRLQRLCDFANGRIPDYYVHPVVRAVLLHFWLAYDHPFVDGNGRTARALFYWSMLRQGYWLCEFLSISTVVKQSPGKYMRAYLYSETDENDATYFVLFHLRVILLAINRLHSYLKQAMIELRATERRLRGMGNLNHRQIALLGHALRHPTTQYSIASHQTSHGVVYQTARSDLLELAKRGLLERSKLGREYRFRAPADLSDRIEGAS